MKLYPEYIMKAVRQNMDLEAYDTSEDKSIMKMDKETVWEKFCVWHGFLGTWGDNLHYAHEKIFGKANDKERTELIHAVEMLMSTRRSCDTEGGISAEKFATNILKTVGSPWPSLPHKKISGE